MGESNDLFLDSFYVARQPVFDTEKKIWGYELLFRNSGSSNVADVGNEDAATSQVIADGFGLIQEDIEEDQRLLVNFPRNMLLEGAADFLPPEICVVEILEHVQPEQDVIEALQSLKEKGFTIALDDYIGQDGFEPFVELADIVKVDCLDLERSELANIAGNLKQLGVQMLAEKVEDNEMFELCSELGFELFQGFFFSRPEIIPGKKISTSNINRMRLLGSISGDNFDVEDLTRAINSDVSVSYRLLKFMNSPTFGLPNKINSIQQAIALIGYRKLAGWLRMILLSDISSGPAGDELAFLSIKRAKFLELVARELKTCPLSSESMFMLGLFSLLDVFLNRPMEELMAELPVEKELIQALTNKNSNAAIFLDIVKSLEKADWDGLTDSIMNNGLSPLSVARNHLAAMQWANEIVLMSKAKESPANG
ncbi:EAL and HDOD domain-containing protein [Desulfovibrio sp. JC010]|uniref:EAL and HDOD domain-containing protein n=1 Tax=Desulfovibrio sp. JC010 TaxID=2593641 RepID=UPI0013D04079|nr:HDOD domain-containing protein [Desulfovibrio sp. JC010]NDV25646.1 EAL domain-containing protein [Desulfovibrio sp. JC010]